MAFSNSTQNFEIPIGIWDFPASHKKVRFRFPKFEYVLTAIYLLRGEGYAVSITEKVDEMTGKENLISSTFAALSRLEGRGLVESRKKSSV